MKPPFWFFFTLILYYNIEKRFCQFFNAPVKISFSRCLCGYKVQLLVTSPYVNDNSMAISHPRIKKPFFMNRVCLKPATPNPKMRSKGIAYIIERGVKLKFVHGILNIEKMPIAVRPIINVMEIY